MGSTSLPLPILVDYQICTNLSAKTALLILPSLPCGSSVPGGGTRNGVPVPLPVGFLSQPVDGSAEHDTLVVQGHNNGLLNLRGRGGMGSQNHPQTDRHIVRLFVEGVDGGC